MPYVGHVQALGTSDPQNKGGMKRQNLSQIDVHAWTKYLEYILHVQTICMSKNVHLGYNDLLAYHHLHFDREQETTRMFIEE